MVRRTFTSREVINEFKTLINQGTTAIGASRKAEIRKQNPLPMVRGVWWVENGPSQATPRTWESKTRFKKLGARGTELSERDCGTPMVD